MTLAERRKRKEGLKPEKWQRLRSLPSILTRGRITVGCLALIVLLLAYIAVSMSISPLPFSVGDKIEYNGNGNRREVVAIHGDFFCVSESKHSTRWIDSRRCFVFDVKK